MVRNGPFARSRTKAAGRRTAARILLPRHKGVPPMKLAIYALASFAALGALVTSAGADEQAERISLAGSWVQTGGNHAWVIENSGDTVHMKQIEGSAPVADFSCTAD